jgi:hypothetical protein
MDLESWLPGRLAAVMPRRRALKVAHARERGKNRSGTFTFVTFGAATAAFILALFGVGPFAVQALVVNFSNGQIPASQVFPAVSPQQKTVVVYDPPKKTQPQPKPTSNPKPVPQPSPSHVPQPSESPEPSGL